MHIDKQSPPIFTFIVACILGGIGGLLVLPGCDSTEATAPEDELADVAIVPETATLEVGEQLDFAVIGLTTRGDTIRNVSLDLQWESTDPSVFTVETGGNAIGQEPGTAYCTVEANSESASKAGRIQRFVGRDSAFVSVF